jgi:hypothetical protein
MWMLEIDQLLKELSIPRESETKEEIFQSEVRVTARESPSNLSFLAI